MKAIGQFLTDINPLWLLAGFAAILVALFFVYSKFPKTKPFRGQLLVITGFCLFTLLFFLMALTSRSTSRCVTPASLPTPCPTPGQR